jgi:hypothetical protein
MTAITTEAIASGAIASTADLFLITYCLLDDLYGDLVPEAVRRRPGHTRMELSDPEVLTLSVMQEALSVDSETAFIRFMHRDHADLFPDLLDRSRYHRRRKALVGVQQALFARIAAELSGGAAWLIVDSAPVETTKVERSQTGAISVPEAAYHVRAARKLLFFGLRLHLVVTDEGAVAEFALAPANEPERDVAVGMLRGVAPSESGLVLGDAGYTGEDFHRRVAALNHEMWAVPKCSAPPPEGVSEAASKAWRRWVRARRSLVETVFAMLADQFGVEQTRARSLEGIWTRVVAKVLAFDLGVYLNRQLGRPLLAIKPLFL